MSKSTSSKAYIMDIAYKYVFCFYDIYSPVQQCK